MERNRELIGLGDIEVNDDRLLAAADDYGFYGLCSIGIQFLMGYVRRHIDKVARSGILCKFQMITPSEAGAAFDDIEHGFHFAMVVCAGSGIGRDHYSAGPELARTRSGMSDSCRARHPRRLGSIGIEFARTNYPDSVGSPVSHSLSVIQYLASHYFWER